MSVSTVNGPGFLASRAMKVLLTMQPARVPWQVLVRNAIAVILPLGLGIGTGELLAGLAVSVGAICTMNSDQPGPYRQRLARLLAVSAAAGVATFLGVTLNRSLPELLAAALVVGFCGALLVALGDAIARVGMAAMILLVVATDLPAPNLSAALQVAVAIGAGGLLLTVFSVAAWPLQRYGPEREALASVYRGLAALARRPQSADAAPAVTEGMTTLRHTLLGIHRSSGPVMDSFGVLLELGERMRLELISLGSDAPSASSVASAAEIEQAVAREGAAALEAIAAAIVNGHDDSGRLSAALAAWQSAERHLAESEQTSAGSRWRHFQALSGQLSAAARNAGRAGLQGVQRSAEEELRLPRALRPQSTLGILRASLSPRSAACRHAIRSAVCYTAALWLGRSLGLGHGYWAPMTVAIVLRADYGATFSYGVLRVAGTVLGLVLTTALVYVLPGNPWVHLAVMAVLCVGFRYFAAAHYGVAVVFMTGIVVLLLALAGEAPEPTMVARLLNTVVGSAMALAAYGLWPTWERGRARGTMARLLEAYATYLAALGSAREPHERADARHAARIARGNAEASVKRLLVEPATPVPLAELAQSLLTNSNRLARTVMTLEAVLSPPRPADERPTAVDDLIRQSAAALREVAEALRTERPAEPLPAIRVSQRHLARLLGTRCGASGELQTVSDRLVDNINTLAHIVAGATPAMPVPQAA